MNVTGLYVHNTSGECYECQQIKHYAEKQGLRLVEPWRLTSTDRRDITLTFNRSYFAKNSELQIGKQINDFYRGLFWKDKRNQINYLDSYIPKPKTIISTHGDFVELREQLRLPFIAKRSTSSQGKGVFMIHTPEEFRDAVDCDVFQEVIWNSIGRDLRIWVLGGEILGVMQRNSTDGSFKANIHQGGIGVPYPVSNEIKKVTESISTQTGLDMIGIDLLFGDDGYYFCELNVCPGFHGFDECFNTNTADKIVYHLLRC